jgi:predicted RNase H-like HicB family nuclease
MRVGARSSLNNDGSIVPVGYCNMIMIQSRDRTPVVWLKCVEIQFTTRVFKEGRSFVAHALELDISSCGGTKEKALKNIKEAVRLFVEQAEAMGTLDQILKEAGYTKSRQKLEGPKVVSMQRISLPLPGLTHAKT